MIGFQDNRLPTNFYTRSDVVQIARELLGKTLVTCFEGQRTAGIIVETEAYCGERDRACHAHLGKFTKRTEVMYREGGTAYIYLCYGMHHLFNVVTNVEGKADAVLIRAIQPTEGIEIMLQRRKLAQLSPKLTAGPGIVSVALGISKMHNGIHLAHSPYIWIENAEPLAAAQIVTTTRIGVDYAQEDALLPWRFVIKDNPWCSRFTPPKLLKRALVSVCKLEQK
ncbi:MAG: DNA-3-methyladenine glycosylase [Microscillaceae bacterium]|nr:DNA-3-methyladenine glycosylase [Microscillaceae bacterium]MDW8460177.1 DNA-3-methyladenine glycosylase [Cytophagales bacterium]